MSEAGPMRIGYPIEEPPAFGAAVLIAEGVYWIRLSLPMALDHVNAYALDDGDGWTLIDTGLDTRKTRGQWQAVLDGPLAGKPVRRVVLTHYHPDHVGLAAWFQTEHGAELVTTRTSYLYARMLTLDVQERPTPEQLAFWKSAGMDTAIYDARREERPFNFADGVGVLRLGYTRIQQDDVITMGGRRWVVHIGHGHAPEHATFWSLDDDLVIAGDQIISSISPNIGLYPTEPEADPVAEWDESCRRLATLARPEHVVLAGHKRPFTGLPLRMRQLIENHEGALRRLRAHLAAPHTAGECFPPMFKREIRASEYGLALAETMAHVVHLWHRGELSRHRRADGAWLWQMKG
ncbi:MBL fold metallo-hydrolase [Pseudoruegeria sp. SHC-113]|uniref:MBL fold metallo-hydrolase n=1 Tax=Pseudoruegeria sp. SHC-113 TaxID=2855439 RepID=UPI0021BAE137|nr:MBL fold metallo-hydrolase [Pseudoruegeria sp. SHC-113]